MDRLQLNSGKHEDNLFGQPEALAAEGVPVSSGRKAVGDLECEASTTARMFRTCSEHTSMETITADVWRQRGTVAHCAPKRARESSPGAFTRIYCRLSKDDDLQGESASIAHQREYLESYCASQGWQVVQVYQDDGYTGLNMNRPDLQRMLADAERGKVPCPTWWNRQKGLRKSFTRWEKEDPENGRFMWDFSVASSAARR